MRSIPSGIIMEQDRHHVLIPFAPRKCIIPRLKTVQLRDVNGITIPIYGWRGGCPSERIRPLPI
jgi:hypothetical protein